MQVSEITFANVSPVDSYGPGFFRVAGKVLHGSVLITGTSAIGWNGLDDMQPLLALKGRVEVLILGIGAEMTGRPMALMQAMDDIEIGVELMNSPTACRAYNVLLAEGRRVALAAIPV